MYQQIEDLMSKMRPEQVPECWLSPADILNHLTDEAMETEIDPEELED